MEKDAIGGVASDITTTISLHFKQVLIGHGDAASVDGKRGRFGDAVDQILTMLPAIAGQVSLPGEVR